MSIHGTEDKKTSFVVGLTTEKEFVREDGTIFPKGMVFGGGSLIHPYWVLSAAHCIDNSQYPFFDSNGKALSYKDTGVAISAPKENTLDNRLEKTPIIIESIYVHPHWNTSIPFHSDVVLYKLAYPIYDRDIIKLAPKILVESLRTYGGRAYVTGWGSTTPYDVNDVIILEFPETARTVSLNVADNFRAKKTLYPYFLSDTMMVTYGDDGEDACNGDSGSPLWVIDNDGIMQIGIVSWGLGCGQKGRFGVFTDISVKSIRDWIKYVTNEDL